ncbi:MAG: hypothetical protein NNA25_10870 [Nitrospira sp.]|nr:hypothetical protein [Nitrospira sp.]
MKGLGVAMAITGLLTLASGVSAWAAKDDGSKVIIKSPTQGAKVGSDVEIVYELIKGSEATHAHCFVDGEYQKGWKGTVKGLSRGTHEIKVVAADKDHQALAAEASVIVEVE